MSHPARASDSKHTEGKEGAISGFSFQSLDLNFIVLMGLFLIMLFYALSFARAFFLPVVLAWLLSFMLRPMVRILEKISIPKPVSAALILIAMIVIVGTAIVKLYGPAMTWIASAPKSLTKVETKVRQLLKPAESVNKAVEQVEKMTSISKETKIEVTEQSSGTVVDWSKSIFFGAIVMFVLLYFLLSSGDHFLRKVIKVLDSPEDKKSVVEITRKTETTISSYLFTVAIINTCVGLAMSLVMWLLGLPNPVLWGTMAGLLNFVPYLGPFCTASVIAFVSLLHFDSPAQAALPPVVYLTCHAIESYAITPTILGKKLALSPVVIFISVIFWGWLWGIPGAMIAVPLLMAFKILCDQIPQLNVVSEFLSP